MDATGRMKRILFLLHVLFMSGMSSTTMVNISSSVGKNVSLPCAVNSDDNIVVQIQWQKQVGHDQEEQIVIYNPSHGEYKSPGHKGRLRAINASSGRPESFHLDLEDLELQDSAIYICDINTFPSGASRQYVNLQVKGEEDGSTPAHRPTTEVPASHSSRPLEGTPLYPTRSSSSTAARNSDALSATPNTERPSTPSDSSSSSKESKTSSVSLSFASSTKEPQTTTRSLLLQDSNVTVTQRDPMAWTKYEQSTASDEQNASVESLPNATTEFQTAMGTLESRVNNITDSQHEPGLGTQKNAHETVAIVTSSDSQNHGNTFTGAVWPQTTKPGLSPKVTTASGERYYPVFIILPFLSVLIIIGLLYRRYLIQKRMDLPPPFKPPPPPVKYTSVRTQEILMTDILV
ncbi:T-cell surface protein tactile-like isoform X2 [Clupea harengus]|uniref:T-cell surface protein tactile-like isoform X2 n=1 Tax=Clupea harengus TaxID=7950 RepID=A0A6P8FIG8_CLUHA|nr:T-cell surface protein tactile-like isoform X2 [Clupea harengus]